MRMEEVGSFRNIAAPAGPAMWTPSAELLNVTVVRPYTKTRKVMSFTAGPSVVPAPFSHLEGTTMSDTSLSVLSYQVVVRSRRNSSDFKTIPWGQQGKHGFYGVLDCALGPSRVVKTEFHEFHGIHLFINLAANMSGFPANCKFFLMLALNVQITN